MNTVQGGSIVLAVALLARTGENGPSIAKESFPFLCAAVAIFLAVLLYTLTQPLIAKIYAPDSAIYSLRSQQQAYMPYMTACSTFDPPTQYSICMYIYI